MPVIKTLPLEIGSGTIAAGTTSDFHGADVSEYVSLGIDFEFTTSATSGNVYLKIYGCNDEQYSTNTKFNIITYQFDLLSTSQHFSVKCLEFRNLAVSVVNDTNASITYSIKMVGVRLT